MKDKKLKVCLYLELPNQYKQCGIGKALEHQKIALNRNNIDYTLNPKEEHLVIHINSSWLFSYLQIKKAKKQGVKVVIDAHMTSEDFRKSFFLSNLLAPFLHKWLNHLYSLGDVIIVHSKYTKGLLKNNYKSLKKKKIIVVSNGVDIKKWKPNSKKAKKFKKDYKIKGPMVFGVGMVFARKGIADFIKTAKKLSKAQFLWIGRYRQKLVSNKAMNEQIKTKPNNFMFTGFVEDIQGAYSAGDIFLFPSYEENEGIVILEAAAMKKAMVVRDIPCFRSYMKHNKHCLMGKNNEDFKKQVSLLLKDSKLRKKLAKNAYNLAQERSLEKVGLKLKNVYNEVLLK